MKQRIRGLVSLHEIPFSSRALQREEGNWPHYTKREGEGGVCGDWGGRWKGGGKKKLSEFAVFHISSLSTVPLSMAATPPVTSHIAIQEVFFRFAVFWQGEEVGGVTLALKPAMVLPPGQTTRQLSKRKRVITVRMRESWESRGGHGCHGDLLKDVSTLVYLWAGRACTAGPLTEQTCVRTRLCVHVFISMWVKTLTCRHTPRPINWPFHSFLCKQTCTDKHTNTASLNRSPPYQLGIIEPTGVGW